MGLPYRASGISKDAVGTLGRRLKRNKAQKPLPFPSICFRELSLIKGLRGLRVNGANFRARLLTKKETLGKV